MPTDTTTFRPRPMNRSDLSALRHQEPYYDSFHLWSLKVRYDFRSPTSPRRSSYWKRDVYQIDGFDGSPAEHLNYTQFVPNLYPGQRYDLADRTGAATDLARRGGLPVGGRAVLFESAFRLHDNNQSRRLRGHHRCRSGAVPWAAMCAGDDQFYYAATRPIPTGPHVQRQQSEHPQPEGGLR